MAMLLCLMLALAALIGSLQFGSVSASVQHTIVFVALTTVAFLAKGKQREIMLAAIGATLPLVLFHAMHLEQVYVLSVRNPRDPNIGLGLLILSLPCLMAIAAGVGWFIGWVSKKTEDLSHQIQAPLWGHSLEYR